MRTFLLASAAVLVMVPGAIRSDEAADKKVQDALQGTWKIVSISTGGKESELNLVLVVKTDGMTLKQPAQDQKEQFRFVLDTSVTPSAIDIYKSDNGKRAEKVFEGVFSVDGDDFRICFAPQPGPPWNRPAALQPAGGEALVVFRKD
jgi:uncharacterized protein (TIGR03067 family)